MKTQLLTINCLFLLGCMPFFISCKKKTSDTGTLTAICSNTISYNTTIQPLIEQNCTTSGCHNSANAGGYNLTSHGSVSANAMIILKAIRHDGSAKAMPQGGAKLATQSADNFDCWIQQGKLNN